MASKVASAGGPNGMHTSGIFADMTVDGPEIGTLVIVLDRAKNLPNRRAMGKQSAYCACRLGKEAKKTETDKRGGQTPKWDQELRFTVHEGPDYRVMKLSIFSEDKRTDLIGEAWVDLESVVVPGGGKSDLWQGLNCKGKYAGEVRIELTYYDTRPKPEKAVPEELRQSTGKVKRRPLPHNPNALTPDAIDATGLSVAPRARHGPRDPRTPARASSTPPESMMQHNPPSPAPFAAHASSAYNSPQAMLQEDQYFDEPQPHYPEQQHYVDPYQQPDFLPQIPPSNRQHGGHQRTASRQAQPAQPIPLRPRPQSHVGLPHSHSAPIVPVQHAETEAYDDEIQLRTEYPEPIPDLDYQHRQVRQRRNDVPPGWQEEYGDPYLDRPGTSGTDDGAPPPPPMHSNSAPVVPHYTYSQQSSPVPAYDNTPPRDKHHSVPNVSPLQSIERRYAPSQHDSPRGHSPRGQSVDSYTTPPEQSPYGSTPPNIVPGQSSGSPYSRSRGMSARHSVADPYGQTAPRPHPLSQEVPRARSPVPPPTDYTRAPSPLPWPQYDYQQQDYHLGHDAQAPLIKPRAVSPRPAPPAEATAPRARSTYNIQFPVRAHESSDDSPLSNSRLTSSVPRTPITRKPTSSAGPSPNDTGVSPAPGAASGSMPFSPDSFSIHNPNAASRVAPLGTNSPHDPYATHPDSSGGPAKDDGLIVGWHGQEIDPSDHLPVDSWAPEPKKKTPTKTYGLGRDRDFGPRPPGYAEPFGSSNSGMHQVNLSKDTVVSMRMRPANHPAPATQPTTSAPSEARGSTGRNRLRKSQPRSPAIEPLREHHNYNSPSSPAIPNPYAQLEGQSRGFMEGRPAYGAETGAGLVSPAKVPLDYREQDALAREIGAIDIGGGSGRGRGGLRFEPVRSQRDRGSYY